MAPAASRTSSLRVMKTPFSSDPLPPRALTMTRTPDTPVNAPLTKREHAPEPRDSPELPPPTRRPKRRRLRLRRSHLPRCAARGRAQNARPGPFRALPRIAAQGRDTTQAAHSRAPSPGWPGEVPRSPRRGGGAVCPRKARLGNCPLLPAPKTAPPPAVGRRRRGRTALRREARGSHHPRTATHPRRYDLFPYLAPCAVAYRDAERTGEVVCE